MLLTSLSYKNEKHIKKEKNTSRFRLTHQLGKKLLYFFFIFYSNIIPLNQSLAPFCTLRALISRFLSFYFSYIAREIIITIVSPSHCTFLYQKNAWADENFKILKSKNRRILNALLAREISERSLVQAEDVKRLEVHACSPRPHIVPTSSPYNPWSHFTPRVHIFFTLVLCLYLSQSLSSIPLFQFPGFTSKGAFCCCAAFRQFTVECKRRQASLLIALIPLRASHAAGHVTSFILRRDTRAIYVTSIYTYDRYHENRDERWNNNIGQLLRSARSAW